jgi:hypothetical protein
MVLIAINVGYGTDSDECWIWYLSICRTSLAPTLGTSLRVAVGAVARLGFGQIRNPDSISDKYK